VVSVFKKYGPITAQLMKEAEAEQVAASLAASPVGGGGGGAPPDNTEKDLAAAAAKKASAAAANIAAAAAGSIMFLRFLRRAVGEFALVLEPAAVDAIILRLDQAGLFSLSKSGGGGGGGGGGG
jgi:hypothetical protein